jgi:tetratricopeptide (TPR) repeat protein
MTRRKVFLVCLTASLATIAGHAAASPLDDRMAAFSEAGNQNEANVTAILQAGLAEHRSAEAIAKVRSWLRRNHLKSQPALFHAGQTAERAGEWLMAVGFYQRLLQTDNVDRRYAEVATTAAYRLLLNAIHDENAAYLFMRKNGNRLRSFGAARKFDRWFLDQAKTRRDLIAMCDRLAVIANDRATDQARFSDDLKWLCSQYEQFGKEAPDAYASAMRLAATNAPALFRARLKWVATVMPYNQNLDELRNANAPADPKLTDASLAAAAELLRVDPNRGAILVAQGWGVEYDHHHSGNCEKRFNVEGERKLAQLLAVLPRMSTEKRDDLLAFQIAQNRVKFDPVAVRKVVISHPGMLNSLTVSDIPLFDKTITVDEAKSLAPQLARNPHAQAAMVRAWARPDRKYSTVTDYMMQSEMWRFDDIKALTHGLWHSGMFERDVEHHVPIDKYANLDSRYQQLKKQVDSNASSNNRLSAFNALQADLLSASPRIVGVLPLWDELFTNAPNADKARMLTKLTTDLHSEVMKNAQPSSRQDILRDLLGRAVAMSRFGDNNSYATLRLSPNIHDHWYHNWRSYGVRDLRSSLPEFSATLDGLLRQQIEANRLSGPILSMWMHCVDPKQEEATALMDALKQSAAYERLDVSYYEMAAHTDLFGPRALSAKRSPVNPSIINSELLALPKDAAPAQVEAALRTVTDRVAKAPVPVAVIGLQPVAALPEWSPTTLRLVLSLFKENAPIGEYPTRHGYEELIQRVCKELPERKQWGDIEPYLPGLWHAAAWTDDHNQYRGAAALSQFAEAALAAEQVSIALSAARNGSKSRAVRDMMASINPSKTETLGRVSQVEGKASIALGIIDIPVDARDPAFPIYKSQAEFALGNLDSAWELYDKNADQLLPVVRKLTVQYGLWLLDKDIERRNTERAEALVKELMIWSRQEDGTLTAQEDAELKIAYADIAFQKGVLQTARAWYRRVADAEEHQGTELQYTAMLRTARLDRVAKNFGSALTELDKLMLIKNDDLRTRAQFARSEVFYDQERYADAYQEIASVLKRRPHHEDALILMGKIQLEMRKLVDASEIEVGASRDQKVIVPGETIKINLSDPTLSISGVTTDIEVEIWSESGDRERVMLHQLGDDKTKYRAEIPARLAAPRAGDKILQVLGRDSIRYGYSERFRAKMTDLPPDPEVVIEVASDARLDFSAGAFPPREGERKLDLEELGLSSSQQALGTRQVRPGNPVYVRILDPDQSKTDQVDEIVVSLETSSGDVISHLALTETGPHTGEFEAIVPTATAQALAFASESAPDRDANMVISAQPYPGWAGVVGSKADYRVLGVDLNDNVAVNKMTVRCPDPTQTLTHFVVQTSMNGQDWVTRARYPDDPDPWDGRPRVTSFPTYGRAIPISTAEDRRLPEDWREKMELLSARAEIPYSATTVPGLGDLNLELASGGHPGYPSLMRYRALFYQPAAAIRTFRLTGFPLEDNTQTIFLLDGLPCDAESDEPLTIKRELRPGLHEIEVWRNESRAKLLERKPVLLSDVAGEDELQPCPESMFDPGAFPTDLRETIAKPAVIGADEHATRFDIQFGDRSQARLVRLVIVGHEGASPAVEKITLTDRDEKQRLPVETDYQQLRGNQQLEVIPGDQVTVRYEDDRSVTPNRYRHERRLGVAYNTATISASFLTYESTEEGQKLILEDIRRFELDDKLAIVINDPDMDQSGDRDEIGFTVTPNDGDPVAFTAFETEPHSGVFLGRVFPVSGTPTRDTDVQVAEGGTLTATYRDAENLDPGIPTDRSVTVEHARYTTPELSVYTISSSSLPPNEPNGDEIDDDEGGPEVIVPRRVLRYSHVPAADLATRAPRAVIGSTLRFDVVAPHLAFSESSLIAAYVQTDAGREAHDSSESETFDVRMPGTLKLSAQPSTKADLTEPDGYVIGSHPTPPNNRPPLDEGRFSFAVPLVLGDLPSRSFATELAESLPSSQIPDGLAVKRGDRVHVGYAYKDAEGDVRWQTATFTLDTHAFLDVMKGDYRRSLTSAYVGEKLYVRLVAPGLDADANRNLAKVMLRAASGASTPFELRETASHSGVFKGAFALTYGAADKEEAIPSVVLHGFPVKYGDQVELSFADAGSDSPPPLTVVVNKGADGTVEPFSKRYGEDAVAIQTTFTLAECYFELAKHHRKMEQESLARREMGQAQKLLAEAVATHQDDAMRAHAEYLLGNLAQEYADLSKNDESRRLMYQDALARFSKIPLDYPDTEFAAKAQFKKALVYEKMGEVDIAVEEYVKLAYKYPDHELIPSVMSRLGAYFQNQGLIHKQRAETLENKEDDVEAAGEAIRLRELATNEYVNAARVFAKLQDRFPNDPLAELAGLRSAQNYMRARDFATAVESFQIVIDNERYDGKTIRAQALYWSALSQERLGDIQEAYEMYRRITFDFPDSIWAKYGRGRLADPVFERIIEQEELARERMLESLKKG